MRQQSMLKRLEYLIEHTLPLKVTLKTAQGKFRQKWHKNLPRAVLNHNTGYHASLSCEPSRVFHSTNTIQHTSITNMSTTPNPKLTTSNNVAEEVRRTTSILHDKTKKNIMQSYLRFKAYHDRKAQRVTVSCR